MENHELELITDLFGRNPRQGPGSDTATKKALDLTGIDLKEALNILDVGCGAGAQTMALARFTKGNITAVDLSEHLLKILERKVSDHGFADQVKTLSASMDQLPFQGKETFDLIWSEGAIYNIGFEEGITYWKSFLKPGGSIAISENSWISNSRPEETELYKLYKNHYGYVFYIARKP